jgi:hypothetical protein
LTEATFAGKLFYGAENTELGGDRSDIATIQFSERMIP